MKALLIVDVQNDFMPGGALGVPEGFQIIPILNKLIQKHTFDFILATKDWHPEDHGSFASTHGKKPGIHIQLNGLDQILWPVHCVQNTNGSEFAPGLETAKIDKVFYKGTEKNVDSYSAFSDNAHNRSTGLYEFLKANNVDEVYIAGLATDYCVKYSVLDAQKLGLKSYVIEDACRGINLKPDDIQNALKEMQQVGAVVIKSSEL